MARTLSLLAGLIGIIATGAALRHLQNKKPEWNTLHFWFMGIAALFPAWLVAFLGLLQPVNQQNNVPLPPAGLFSSAAGLLGVIASNHFVRRSQQPGRALSPFASWLFGWLALLPAWLILLLRL
jgi:hypothetical protein